MAIQIEFAIRLLIALAAGVTIGYERELRSKEAGTRTHALVCIASAALMIIGKYGFEDSTHFDASRIASQVVTGIGFLGAGLIYVSNEKVRGLTTAAGVWATAAVGLAFGSGMYIVGLVATVIIVIVQRYTNKKLHRKIRMSLTFHISLNNPDDNIPILMDELTKRNVSIGQIILADSPISRCLAVIPVVMSEEVRTEELLHTLEKMDGVVEVKVGPYHEN